MRIARIVDQKQKTLLVVEHADGSLTELAGDLFGKLTDTGKVVTETKRLSPLDPSHFLCIGLNYAAHAAETGKPKPDYPVLFMKSGAAILSPNMPIELPRKLASTRVDYEGELAVVIGRCCKNVSREEALGYVLGYTCANDVSARDWQKEFGGGQFCRGKTFDTFAPLGPVLVTADTIPDPQQLTIKTTLNGQVMQESPTSDMIFDVATLVSFLSGSTTLQPGTVILTGTPQGVGMARSPQVFLQPGDLIEVEISEIGKLSNPVVEEVF